MEDSAGRRRWSSLGARNFLPEGEIPGVFGWIPGLLLWRLLCNRDCQPRPRIVQVYRRVRTPNFKKDDDPYAFKLLNQEVHSLGISMDNKTETMTKWQAHKKLGAAGGSKPVLPVRK
jgi:hypothetical protein